MQDSSAVAAPAAAVTPASTQLCGSAKGRRASCPEANLPSRSYRAHRQALEEQQRAATVFMSDKSKVRLRCCVMTRYQYCVGCELMTPFLMALRPPDLSPKTLEHMKRCESMCAACVVCVFSFRILARVYTFRHLCDASIRFFAAEGIRSSFVCSAFLLAVVALHCFRGKSSTLPNLFFGAHFRIAIVDLQDILEVTT